MKKKPILFVVVILLLAFLNNKFEVSDFLSTQTLTAADSTALTTAFNNRQSNKIITATGTVIKVLADDNQGSRHQKFIVRASSTLTILIAHNIDLAPRVKDLKIGDNIEFSGEYEWNSKGGVVHWTHHDPQGLHPAGWIKYHGKIYQ